MRIFGHIVSAAGIRPDPSKVQCVVEAEFPKTRKQTILVLITLCNLVLGSDYLINHVYILKLIGASKNNIQPSIGAMYTEVEFLPKDSN